jgi:hypothetical protein
MAKNQSKFDPSRQIAAPSYAPDAYTDWFPVRITGTTEGPPSGYTFVEVWLLPDGSIADKTGGRVNDDNTPAVSLAGDLAEDDIALCRVASGVGGQAFELSPIGGGGGVTPLLVEVTGFDSSSHTVKRKTWVGGVVVDYTPTQTFSLAVSPAGGLPTGTLCYLLPIPDVSGYYWISPHAAYATATLPGLLSHAHQQVGGVKFFRDNVWVGQASSNPDIVLYVNPADADDVGARLHFSTTDAHPTSAEAWRVSVSSETLRIWHRHTATVRPSFTLTRVLPYEPAGIEDPPIWATVTAHSNNPEGWTAPENHGGYAVRDHAASTFGNWLPGLWGNYTGGVFAGGILVGASSFAGGSATPDTTTSGGSPTVLSTVVIPPETLGTTPGTASTIETEATVEIDPSSTVELEITFGGDPVLQTGNQSTGIQPSVGVAKVRTRVTGPDSVRASAEWMPAGISGGTRVASVDVTGLDFSQPIDLVVTATASAGAATLRAIDVHPRWRPAEPDVDGGAFDGTGGRGWLVMGDNYWQNSISDI